MLFDGRLSVSTNVGSTSGGASNSSRTAGSSSAVSPPVSIDYPSVSLHFILSHHATALVSRLSSGVFKPFAEVIYISLFLSLLFIPIS